MKLTPWVDGDYWEQDGKGAWKKYRQVVTRGTASEDARRPSIRRVKSSKGVDNFRGLPIYAGHPDAESDSAGPMNAGYGGIMDMEVRADGIWVKPAWNDLGRGQPRTRLPGLSFARVALHDLTAQGHARGASSRWSCAASA